MKKIIYNKSNRPLTLPYYIKTLMTAKTLILEKGLNAVDEEIISELMTSKIFKSYIEDKIIDIADKVEGLTDVNKKQMGAKETDEIKEVRQLDPDKRVKGLQKDK